jgi:hypothetical protein
MTVRVQVLLSPEERERFRAIAEAEGLSLSAWLRQAGLTRLAGDGDRRRFGSVKELNRFFADCDAEEKGREPDWEEVKAMIEAGTRSGGSGT